MICICGLIYSFARANTIGVIPLGDTVAGLAFIGGQLCFCFLIGMGIWAKGRGKGTIYEGQLTGSPALSRIFGMMLIIILAFSLVGLVKAGQ